MPQILNVMSVHSVVASRRLREDVDARARVPVSAIVLDAAALAALLVTKGRVDSMIVVSAVAAIGVIFLVERFFLTRFRVV